MKKLPLWQIFTGITVAGLLFMLTYPDLLKADPERKGSLPTGVDHCVLCHSSPAPKVKVEGVEFEHSPYIENRVNCSFCHPQIIQGQGKVLSDNCFTCHASGEFLQETPPTETIHQIHVTGRRVECTSCHERIFHPVGKKIVHWRGIGEKDSSPNSCSSCHGDQHLSSLLVYTGRGRDDVEPQPSVMARINLVCQGCHQGRKIKQVDERKVQIATANPEACDTCHGKGFGKTIIPMWQGPVREKYKKLTERLKETIAKGDEGRQLLEKAEDILELVRTDGSWGAHNPGYVNLLLKKVEGYLEEAEKLSS